MLIVLTGWRQQTTSIREAVDIDGLLSFGRPPHLNDVFFQLVAFGRQQSRS
jgi:hypothetical protein